MNKREDGHASGQCALEVGERAVWQYCCNRLASLDADAVPTDAEVQERCKSSQGDEQKNMQGFKVASSLEVGEGGVGLDGLAQLVDPLGSVGAHSNLINATELVACQAAGCRKSAIVHWALNKTSWGWQAHLSEVSVVAVGSSLLMTSAV